MSVPRLESRGYSISLAWQPGFALMENQNLPQAMSIPRLESRGYSISLAWQPGLALMGKTLFSDS